MKRSEQFAAPSDDAVSAWRIALTGMLGLAAAVGIGRFAFTPILPMMQDDTGLSVAQGGWLASANYVGYLLGALWATAQRARPAYAIRWALISITLTTLAMSWVDDLAIWIVLRTAAGVASAWGLIHTSAWCIERLSRLGQPVYEGAVFAGVGVGIVIAGASCLLLMQYGAGSGQAWLVLGGVCLIFSVTVWPALNDQEIERPRSAGDHPEFRWTPDAIRLVLCYGATGVGYIIPATFLPVMAKKIIPDTFVFGWAWPVFGLAAAVSTLFTAPLIRVLGNRRLWIIGALVMALGVVFPLMLPGIAGIAIAATLVGGSFMVTTMAGIREAKAVANDAAPTLVAAFTAAFAAGQIVGPMLVTALVVRYGTIAPALAIGAAALIASVAALLVCPDSEEPDSR